MSLQAMLAATRNRDATIRAKDMQEYRGAQDRIKAVNPRSARFLVNASQRLTRLTMGRIWSVIYAQTIREWAVQAVV
ncbi:MAG: hypothetical protein HKN70_11570 [Gammaproteobacteria bacterium]|nr:hypothetical protein [Gammaproteobacteria bacterium]